MKKKGKFTPTYTHKILPMIIVIKQIKKGKREII